MFKLRNAVAFLSFSVLALFSAHGQANIQVRIVSVEVQNSVDCDGFLAGNSDFAFEYEGTRIDSQYGYLP